MYPENKDLRDFESDMTSEEKKVYLIYRDSPHKLTAEDIDIFEGLCTKINKYNMEMYDQRMKVYNKICKLADELYGKKSLK